jgi:flagellar biosynthetic protein FlhB
MCLAGVAVNVLQVGFLFLPQRLSFDPSRLSPIRGWQRIFSSPAMVHVGFGMFKLAIVFIVAGVVLYNQREALLGLVALAPPELASQMAHIVLSTAMKIGVALLVLAILDYGYQRWRYEQDLKMTPQELREELRNLEGDPQLIARRKQAQRNQAVASVSPAQPPVETQADGLKRRP